MNPQTLYHLFQRHAQSNPDAPAFFAADGTVSYAQFHADVDRLASGFASLGLSSGERICVLAPNSVQLLQIFVACARTGAVFYPLNQRLSPGEVAGVIALAEPRLLLVAPEHLPQLAETGLEAISHKAVFTEQPTDGFIPYSDLSSSAQASLTEPALDDPLAIISTAAVAAIPRGAVLTHRNFIEVSKLIGETFSLGTRDRFLAVLPLYHIAGLNLVCGMAYAGGASVILPGFDPVVATQFGDQHEVTLLGTFPPMLEMLLEARAQSGASWDNLRYVFGILNPPEVVQRLLAETKAEYWTGYGQSETSGIVTLMNAMENPGSAGKVVPGLEMRLVDDLDEEVLLGEAGEIAIRGSLVFAGYWRDEDATAYASRNGWHHTGDMGKLDEQGYLYYAGRKPEKELIKSGGENVYPAEVEQVIRGLPEVAEVCVIGVPDEKWGETVKAVVELVPGQSLEADALVHAVAEKIASYKKPRIVTFVEVLPRLESGEVDRATVKATQG